MSFIEEFGGADAVKQMLTAFYARVKADDATNSAVDVEQMESLIDPQCNCVCLFINGDTDEAEAAMQDAHAFVVGRGLSDDAFDTFYDHYHDSLAELGIPGGMIHLFLEAFEELRDAATN